MQKMNRRKQQYFIFGLSHKRTKEAVNTVPRQASKRESNIALINK